VPRTKLDSMFGASVRSKFSGIRVHFGLDKTTAGEVNVSGVCVPFEVTTAVCNAVLSAAAAVNHACVCVCIISSRSPRSAIDGCNRAF
jgi:hypothetical protein